MNTNLNYTEMADEMVAYFYASAKWNLKKGVPPSIRQSIIDQKKAAYAELSNRGFNHVRVTDWGITATADWFVRKAEPYYKEITK